MGGKALLQCLLPFCCKPLNTIAVCELECTERDSTMSLYASGTKLAQILCTLYMLVFLWQQSRSYLPRNFLAAVVFNLGSLTVFFGGREQIFYAHSCVTFSLCEFQMGGRWVVVGFYNGSRYEKG